MKKEKLNIFKANKIIKTISDNKLKQILKAENLLKTGFVIDEIKK